MDEATFVIQVLMEKHEEYLEMPDVDGNAFLLHVLACRYIEALKEIRYLRALQNQLSKEKALNQ